MRQTIKEIEVNVAYRWFLGLDLTDKVPHFSTFGKNYVRRFKDIDIFEQIFIRILSLLYMTKNKILKYSTTNLEGYREYKCCPQDCEKCPYLSKCTESQNRTKVVTQHIWDNYIEICEDIRCTRGNKKLYKKEKKP